MSRKLAYLQHLQNYKQLYINESLNSLSLASSYYLSKSQLFSSKSPVRYHLICVLATSPHNLSIHNTNYTTSKYNAKGKYSQKHTNNSQYADTTNNTTEPVCDPTDQGTDLLMDSCAGHSTASLLTPDGSNQVVGTATQHPQVHSPVRAPNSASYRLN